MMLCRVYGISPPADIEKYLVSMSSNNAGLTIGNRLPNREALIIRQINDDVEIGLFINPSIISALEKESTLENIDALSCAIEGASHFLYAIDRILKEKKFSRLELELQGEVDKFLIIHLIASEKLRCISPDFFRLQFEAHSFDTSLDADEIFRYETASHFAAKYCAFLFATYFNPLRLNGLISNARNFYACELGKKLAKLIP